MSYDFLEKHLAIMHLVKRLCNENSILSYDFPEVNSTFNNYVMKTEKARLMPEVTFDGKQHRPLSCLSIHEIITRGTISNFNEVYKYCKMRLKQ